MKATYKFIVIIVIHLSQVNAGLITHGPEKVNENVKIYFSTSLETAFQYKLGDLHKISENSFFNKNHQTAIYIHGFYDDGEKDFSSMAIRGAYRNRNDTNFITIDWQYYSKCFFYHNAVIPQLKVICETIASNLKDFLDLGYDVNKLHMVGHSLGGQCIGLVARQLRRNTNYVIPRLYALDPAAPGFEADNVLTQIFKWVTFCHTDFPMISRSDAEYVQVIHTNAGKYGISSSIGHADFYPNAGSYQAGCDLEVLDDVCSHRRAWVFYQESVFPRPNKKFVAVKCASFEDFKEGKCIHNSRGIMGFSNDRERGTFYLITHSNFLSTSLGEAGINYTSFTVITDHGTTKKPLYMLGSRPQWENPIEFKKLMVVTENGVIEKDHVKVSSPHDVMGDDFEVIEDSEVHTSGIASGYANLNLRVSIILLSVLYNRIL